jgi:hypothetical protein
LHRRDGIHGALRHVRDDDTRRRLRAWNAGAVDTDDVSVSEWEAALRQARLCLVLDSPRRTVHVGVSRRGPLVSVDRSEDDAGTFPTSFSLRQLADLLDSGRFAVDLAFPGETALDGHPTPTA